MKALQKEIRESLFKQSNKPIKVTTKKKQLKPIQTHKTTTGLEEKPQAKQQQVSVKPQGSLVGVGLHSKKKKH